MMNSTYGLKRRDAELFTSSKRIKNGLLAGPSRALPAIELFITGIMAQSKHELEEKRKSAELYYAIIEDTNLGVYGQKVATRVTGNAIIYTISMYLDAEINDTFNLSYHQNSLNVGFRLFIFDAYKVISMNIHALNFFTKLASSAAEYNASICFVGLSFEKTPESFKNDLEDAGLMFFDNMDDILKNKELLEELGGGGGTAVKQVRSLNKALINELPQFIEATVSTIAMMTNAQPTKNSVNIQPYISSGNDHHASSMVWWNIDGKSFLFSQAKSV
jgi:hypothetical protein